MNRIYHFWLAVLIIGMTNSIFALTVNILDFGAVPDGKTLNTLAIQSAIDSISQEGGGRVIVPPGIFLTGALNLKSGAHLYLHEEAVLLGSTLPEHYFNSIAGKPSSSLMGRRILEFWGQEKLMDKAGK